MIMSDNYLTIKIFKITDPEFSANAGSLFCSQFDRPRNADAIEWLRPHVSYYFVLAEKNI